METKEQEAKEAWRDHVDELTSTSGSICLEFLSDFQTAFIEVLEKEKLLDTGYDYNLGFNAGLAKAISLVKTITPKKK